MTSILLKFFKPRGCERNVLPCDLLLGGSQPITQVPGCMTSIPKNFLCIFGAVSCHLETWPNFNKQISNSTHNNFLSSSNTCVELIPSLQSDLPLCVYIKIQPWNTGLSVIRHGRSPDLYMSYKRQSLSKASHFMPNRRLANLQWKLHMSAKYHAHK